MSKRLSVVMGFFCMSVVANAAPPPCFQPAIASTQALQKAKEMFSDNSDISLALGTVSEIESKYKGTLIKTYEVDIEDSFNCDPKVLPGHNIFHVSISRDCKFQEVLFVESFD